MPQHAGFRPGNWLADCDRCGLTFRASKLLDDGEFPGLKVCIKCWDMKHPQELIVAVVDEQAPEWTRPEPPWLFIAPQEKPSVRCVDGYAVDSQSMG